MSYRFGRDSEQKIQLLSHRLTQVCRRAIQIVDFKIIYTHRGELLQNGLFAKGASKVRYPNSKHNSLPSKAFDFAPWPIDWPDFAELKAGVEANDYEAINIYVKTVARFYAVGGVIQACAHDLNVPIRWGADWDGDWDFFDQSFDDLGHVEELG